MVLCDHCLGTVDAQDRFCRFCGQALAQQARSARELEFSQRQFATILFADIVGSTTLVDGLAPEEAVARLGPAVSAMRSAVLERGGTVCRDQGDGLMAVFGAPTSQSDHALRACRAGLAIVAASVRDAGAGLHVRVGIHSGDIIFHHVFVSSGPAYAVAGPAVHLANRLETACAPGQVLVSEATQLLIDGGIATTARGAVTLKGFNEAVQTFALMAEQQSFGWAARYNRSASPWVGRAEEVERLMAVAESALGDGQTVAIACVRGDPGLGKSRLAREAARRLGEGWAHVEVEIDADDTASAHAVLARLCRACADVSDASTATERLFTGHAEAEVLSAALRTVLGAKADGRAWAALEAGDRRKKIRQAVQELLNARLRATGQLVVLLEDLQWADSESLRVLDQLSRQTHEGKIFLLCTARGLAHAPPEHLWYQRGPTIDLQPLDGATTEQLLDDLLGPSLELLRLKGRILEKANGVPLMVEEVVRWLVASRHIQGEKGNYRLVSRAEDFEVPGSVRASVLERASRLGERCGATLRAAAVLGNQFSVELLSKVLGSKPADVLPHVTELIAASMLAPTLGGTDAGRLYAFSHALILESVASTLTLNARRRLHRQALDAYMSSDGLCGDEHVDRLSRHALEARDWACVATYSMRAGRRAIDSLAYLNAAVFFERTIEALYRLPRTAENIKLAIDARLQARISYSATSQLDLCLKRIEQAEQLCLATGDERRLACTVFRAAVINFTGNPRRSIGLAGPAMQEAAAKGDVQIAALASYVVGQAHYGAGRYGASAEALKAMEALLVGEHEYLRAGTTGTMSAMCLGLRTAALGAIGEFEEAQRTLDKASRIAASTRRAFDGVASLFGAGSLYVSQGLPGQALGALEEATRLCRAHAIDSFVTAVAIPYGEALHALGRHEEAVEVLRFGLQEALRLGHVSQTARLQGQLALALVALGHTDEALALSGECLTLSRRFGLVFSQAVSHYARALVVAASPAPERALSEFERACRLCHKVGAWPALARMLEAKSDCLRRTGATRRAISIT